MRHIGMKQLGYGLCGLALSVFIVIALGCEQKAGGLAQVKQSPKADNSRCYVCHMNYEEEELASRHARVGIGCVRCHGASDAHCSDENNVTPPDIMYPVAKINSSCMECHPQDKISRKAAHKPLFKDTAEPKKVCTDCHGKHRLAHRTRKWDKTTGKPIAQSS